MGRIRLVAVDEDGTFLRDHRTYDRERFERIFERMRRLDIRFCVATGNQLYQVRSLFPTHVGEMSVVSANGALVCDGDERIFCAKASDQAVRLMIEAAHARREVPFSMLCADAAYVERAYPEAFFKDMATYCTRQYWVDDYALIDDDVLMFSSVVAEERVGAEIAYFRDVVGDLMDVVSSGEGYFDVVCPTVDKASGLARLCERRGIDPEEVVAFGDSDNDLAMLAFAGLSFAMGNAPAHVREAADHVCPPCDSDGVLETLEDLLS